LPTVVGRDAHNSISHGYFSHHLQMLQQDDWLRLIPGKTI